MDKPKLLAISKVDLLQKIPTWLAQLPQAIDPALISAVTGSRHRYTQRQAMAPDTGVKHFGNGELMTCL